MSSNSTLHSALVRTDLTFGALIAAFYASIMAFSYLGFNLSSIASPFADEVAYMGAGLSGTISLTNGGAAGIAYGIASVFTDNENHIGRLGQFIWYLVPISVTGAMLFVISKKHWITILLIAFFILIDRGTWVGSWPKVGVAMYSMTVAYVILAGLCGSLSKPQTQVQQFVYQAHGFIVLLIGGLFRPELFWGFPLLAILIIFEASRFGTTLRFAAAGISLCAMFLFFLAASSDTSGRAWCAFGQHYSLGLKDRNIKYQNAEPWHEYKQILKDELPEAESISDVILRYPEKFSEHVFHNLRHIPWVVMRKTLLAMILFGVVVYRNRAILRRISISTLAPALSMATVYFLSSALIYPRGHYANTFYAAVIIGALYLVFWSRSPCHNGSHKTDLDSHRAPYKMQNDGAVSPILFIIILVLLFNKQHSVDSYLSGIKGSKGYVNIKLQ